MGELDITQFEINVYLLFRNTSTDVGVVGSGV